MADGERMYINGEWVLADGGATFDVTNPADGTVVARIANGAGPEIQRAVTAAHAAFGGGPPLPAKDGGSILLRIRPFSQERLDGLARLVTLENGDRKSTRLNSSPSQNSY